MTPTVVTPARIRARPDGTARTRPSRWRGGGKNPGRVPPGPRVADEPVRLAPLSSPGRVTVIDSDPLTRAGLCALLRRENARVTDDLGDLPTALSRLPRVRPEFAFVEARLASENGGAPIRAILRSLPSVKVIAFGRGLLEEEIFHVIEAGASGYLLHGAADKELATAMRCAQAGRRYIPPEVELKLQMRQARRQLTPREADVLELLARARSNAAIAVILGISVETVKLHVKSILGKLGVEDRAEAAIIAIQRGLVRLT